MHTRVKPWCGHCCPEGLRPRAAAEPQARSRCAHERAVVVWPLLPRGTQAKSGSGAAGRRLCAHDSAAVVWPGASRRPGALSTRGCCRCVAPAIRGTQAKSGSGTACQEPLCTRVCRRGEATAALGLLAAQLQARSNSKAAGQERLCTRECLRGVAIAAQRGSRQERQQSRMPGATQHTRAPPWCGYGSPEGLKQRAAEEPQAGSCCAHEGESPGIASGGTQRVASGSPVGFTARWQSLFRCPVASATAPP